MNDFSKNFLNEDWKAMPDAPRFFLGAFGKHPGWNDHLDDIGLITDSLIRAKDMIYGGIAHQVENAVWEKGGPDKMSPGFDHAIHWRRMNESLTGLMWSSSDGKGRSLYPMITLTHGIGRAFEGQAAEVLPVLEDVGNKCQATKSSVSVVEILNAAQESLRARLTALPLSPITGSDLGVKEWAAFFSHAPEGLRRVLHHLSVNFAAFAPGSAAWCDNKKMVHAQSRSLRLPVIPASNPAESLNVWLSFLATQLDPAVPMLGLRPVSRNWLDIIVGEPTESDFVVLRTLPTATPIVTEIPYQLNSSLSADETKVIAALGRGELPDVSCLNSATVEANRQAASKWLAKFRLNFFSRFLHSTGSPF